LDLDAFVAHYPGVRVAKPEDNAALLRFFSESAIEGDHLRLRFDRSPDFFGLLKLQGDQSTVFVFESSANEIIGAATVTLRDGYIHGKLKRVGYLGDLRSKFDRRPLRIWREMFRRILQGEVSEWSGCDHWITAVIDENRRAKLALVQSKRGGHRYDLLTPYRMVNVLAKKPWRRISRDPTVTVSRATKADRNAVHTFYQAVCRTQAFGYSRFPELPGLSIEDFWLAKKGQTLVGITSLWSPHTVKRILVDHSPWTLKLLSPWIRAPKAGEPLKVVYLSFLTIDPVLSASERSHVFGALFDHAFQESRKLRPHSVAFCDFARNHFESALGSYLCQSVPMSLYSVRAETSAPESWSEEELLFPGFEIALV
jgi:hypothetical protein